MKASSKRTSPHIGGDFIQIIGVLGVLSQDKVFQQVQAEARSPLPGDAEDIYKGRGLHQAISLEC